MDGIFDARDVDHGLRTPNQPYWSQTNETRPSTRSSNHGDASRCPASPSLHFLHGTWRGLRKQLLLRHGRDGLSAWHANEFRVPGCHADHAHAVWLRPAHVFGRGIPSLPGHACTPNAIEDSRRCTSHRRCTLPAAVGFKPWPAKFSSLRSSCVGPKSPLSGSPNLSFSLHHSAETARRSKRLPACNSSYR